MTKDDFDIMIATGKLKLSKRERRDHFYIVHYILIIPISILILSFYNKYIAEVEISQKFLEMFFMAVFFLCLAVLVYIYQKKALIFKIYNTKVSKQELSLALTKTAQELDWKIFDVGDYYIKAVRHGSFLSGSWGEEITILKTDNKLYLISICKPDSNSIASFGWNKKNVATFINNVNKEIENNKQ